MLSMDVFKVNLKEIHIFLQPGSDLVVLAIIIGNILLITLISEVWA